MKEGVAMMGCYASVIQVEACAANKHRLSVIPVHTAIHFVFSGAGYFNGQRLTAGDGFLHLKDQPGTYYPDPNDPWCYGWMRVGGEDSGYTLAELGIPAILEPPYTFRFTKIAQVRSIMERFDAMGNPLYRAGILREVFSFHPRATAESPNSQKEQWAFLARNEIENSIASTISVTQIALRLRISPSYLRKVYAAVFGISPQEAMIQLRMRRARELLESSAAPVALVAASCGYEDALQFSRIFHKHNGMSPRAYRARVRAREADKIAPSAPPEPES